MSLVEHVRQVRVQPGAWSLEDRRWRAGAAARARPHDQLDRQQGDLWQRTPPPVRAHLLYSDPVTVTRAFSPPQPAPCEEGTQRTRQSCGPTMAACSAATQNRFGKKGRYVLVRRVVQLCLMPAQAADGGAVRQVRQPLWPRRSGVLVRLYGGPGRRMPRGAAAGRPATAQRHRDAALP